MKIFFLFFTTKFSKSKVLLISVHRRESIELVDKSIVFHSMNDVLAYCTIMHLYPTKKKQNEHIRF